MHTDPSIDAVGGLTQLSGEAARRLLSPSRGAEVDLRLSLVRQRAILPWRFVPPDARDDLRSSEVIDAARAAGAHAGAFLIGGGDPLRRPDLWDLLAELVRLRPNDLGLCISGRGLTAPVIERLRAAGVRRLHVPFHCARQDAHDWLVGQPGALKMAHRAIRAAAEAELPVVAEIVLTRPTVLHLAETVEVLSRIGAGAVCVRRLAAEDTDGTAFVPLSPRLSLVGESLEQAAAVALRRRLRLRLRDLPLCVAPRLRRLFAAAESEAWVMADGTLSRRAAAALGCPDCPGPPRCAGAPSDYTARFGWEEFADVSVAAARLRENVEEQRAPHLSAPMVFAWRGPHRVRCDACGDGAEAQSGYESTRAVRARLVQAARYRPSLLRLVGADLLAHPQAAALIFDAVRLFPRVEVVGEASAVVEWSDLDLRRLKDLKRVDVPLYGPDAATHDSHCGIPGAFAAMLRGVQRLGAQEIRVGAYAVLHDAHLLERFAAAWDAGSLPGEPRFRLSARGASLDELAEAARRLPSGPARAAVAALLPRCLWDDSAAGSGGQVLLVQRPEPQRVVHCGRSTSYHSCGSDPIGDFETCREGAGACAGSGCVGTAVGWRTAARSERWNVRI